MDASDELEAGDALEDSFGNEVAVPVVAYADHSGFNALQFVDLIDLSNDGVAKEFPFCVVNEKPHDAMDALPLNDVDNHLCMAGRTEDCDIRHNLTSYVQ